jgi:hypothetical protein
MDLVVPMAPALSPFFRDKTFDPFLFAAIGEERNGMLLSVLSALARLDIDPWREAASLSRLQPPAATARLTSLLSSSTSSLIKAPAPATILRLVGLLPRAAADEVWASGAAVVAKSKLSWPVAVCFLIVIVLTYAEQFAERREPNPPIGVGASPAASAPDPGAKARDEVRGDTPR